MNDSRTVAGEGGRVLAAVAEAEAAETARLRAAAASDGDAGAKGGTNSRVTASAATGTGNSDGGGDGDGSGNVNVNVNVNGNGNGNSDGNGDGIGDGNGSGAGAAVAVSSAGGSAGGADVTAKAKVARVERLAVGAQVRCTPLQACRTRSRNPYSWATCGWQGGTRDTLSIHELTARRYFVLRAEMIANTAVNIRFLFCTVPWSGKCAGRVVSSKVCLKTDLLQFFLR